MLRSVDVPQKDGEPMSKLFRKAAKVAIPGGKRDVNVFDDDLPGFHIRKYDTGKQFYCVKYGLPGGKQRKVSLGSAISGVENDMRRKASDILAKARLGQDVVAEKEAASKRSASIGALITKYLTARRSEVGNRHYSEISRYLDQYWQPLHAMPLEDVARKNIVLRVDEIADEHGKVAADRARTALSAFFSWTIEKGYLDGANPASDIKRRATNGSRARVLSETELAEIWRACREDNHGHICRLLILLGQRKTEIADLAWDEIDRDRALITLSAMRVKNRREHLIPLGTEALAIIESIPARLGRDLLFGEGERGFSGWSACKKRLDGRLSAGRAKGGKPPMQSWVLHDIRRSVVTHLAEGGFAQPHVIESIVNHQSGHKGGIAGVYNRSEYASEKRAALEAWGRRVAVLAGGDQYE
jgi:integrase